MEMFEVPESAEKSDLIVNHIAYARCLSRRFYFQRSDMGIDRDEFQSAAFLGLCDAAQRFDDSRGLNFETFSYLRIRGAMYDLLRRGGWFCNGLTALKAPDAAAGENVEEPSRARRVSSLSVQEFTSLLDSNDGLNFKLHGISADADGETVELSYADALTPEQEAIGRNSREYLRSLLHRLPEKERDLIEMYYFEGRTFEDMRSHFKGVSKSWLSRLHSRALGRLRSELREEVLECADLESGAAAL